ncbi:MAG: glycogen synthase [Ruminococcaceae bacterium]|nr:glycogen synthase [Oscillospiraceae bacterium]
MKKILFAASEALPFAASGGLGDVIGSLPAAIKQADKDCDIRVIMPLYDKVTQETRSRMEKVLETTVELGWRKQYCGLYSLVENGVTYYFIDNEFYYRRGALYGAGDDLERFAFFCKAVVDLLPLIDFYPDYLHAHDWQAAMAVVYLKCLYGSAEKYRDIKAVFTIHNIQYQGIGDMYNMGDLLGLHEKFVPVLEFGGCMNFMKGAIVCADMVSTVSPTYANEILSPEYSHGLHPVLEMCKGKLTGILNGIDREYYNPAKDNELIKNFSYMRTGGKKECKKFLQEYLNLPVKEDVPMVIMITRLVSHKGLDIVKESLYSLLEENIQFVLLGTGDYEYERFFDEAARRFPHKMRTLLKYDKELSKRIYAAGDIFLMPSLSEPCGLAQMIASRYGTVPVVRETGGLYDSIRDYGWPGGGNGFTFAPYSGMELYNAVKRAVNLYSDTAEWEKLVLKVMRYDFSWKKSAKLYIQMYERLN